MKLGSYLLAAFFCSLLGCCSNTVIYQRFSPDRMLVATLFDRDCGATTDFSTMISVTRNTQSFADESALFLVAKGQKNISLKWVGPRTLYVECAGCTASTVFKQIKSQDGIEVKYSFPAYH